MGISIYYTVKRNEPLTTQETKTIDEIIEKYSVDQQIEQYMNSGQGLNWESFCIYNDLEDGIILEGSTKLPNNTAAASWIAIQHWCNLLTEMRNYLPNAVWQVSVEDHQIRWDEKRKYFDPTK